MKSLFLLLSCPYRFTFTQLATSKRRNTFIYISSMTQEPGRKTIEARGEHKHWALPMVEYLQQFGSGDVAAFQYMVQQKGGMSSITGGTMNKSDAVLRELFQCPSLVI